MSKYMKIICVSILIMILSCTYMINNSYAAKASQLDGEVQEPGQEEVVEQEEQQEYLSSEDPIRNPDFYAPTDKGENTALIDLGNTIIGAIRLLGTLIAVVSVMVIGLRYMTGSVEQKANYKETMVPYLIGAVMLFTIPNLLGIIYDLVKSIDF